MKQAILFIILITILSLRKMHAQNCEELSKMKFLFWNNAFHFLIFSKLVQIVLYAWILAADAQLWAACVRSLDHHVYASFMTEAREVATLSDITAVVAMPIGFVRWNLVAVDVGVDNLQKLRRNLYNLSVRVNLNTRLPKN